MGFSTGRWQGDRLVVETTHIKNGWHRRNGVPMSDRATMTEYLVPHEDTFTHIAVIRDPVYLTEPWVKTQHFEIMRRALPANAWLWPCTVVEEVDRDPNEVPHYLPGKNPYMADYRAEVHLDVPGVGGGAATLLPEFARRVANEPATPAQPPRRSGRAASARRAGTAAKPAAQPTDAIETWQIRDNVYMLVGAGANTTVHIGLDGAVVVDPKLEGASDRLLAAIRALTPLPIRFVINTHVHADAMGGNQAVAAAGATRTGGVVVRTIGTELHRSGRDRRARERAGASLDAGPRRATAARVADRYVLRHAPRVRRQRRRRRAAAFPERAHGRRHDRLFPPCRRDRRRRPLQHRDATPSSISSAAARCRACSRRSTRSSSSRFPTSITKAAR